MEIKGFETVIPGDLIYTGRRLLTVVSPKHLVATTSAAVCDMVKMIRDQTGEIGDIRIERPASAMVLGDSSYLWPTDYVMWSAYPKQYNGGNATRRHVVRASELYDYVAKLHDANLAKPNFPQGETTPAMVRNWVIGNAPRSYAIICSRDCSATGQRDDPGWRVIKDDKICPNLYAPVEEEVPI